MWASSSSSTRVLRRSTPMFDTQSRKGLLAMDVRCGHTLLCILSCYRIYVDYFHCRLRGLPIERATEMVSLDLFVSCQFHYLHHRRSPTVSPSPVFSHLYAVSVLPLHTTSLLRIAYQPYGRCTAASRGMPNARTYDGCTVCSLDVG